MIRFLLSSLRYTASRKACQRCCKQSLIITPEITHYASEKCQLQTWWACNKLGLCCSPVPISRILKFKWLQEGRRRGRVQRQEPRAPKHEPQHITIGCRSWKTIWLRSGTARQRKCCRNFDSWGMRSKNQQKIRFTWSYRQHPRWFQGKSRLLRKWDGRVKKTSRARLGTFALTEPVGENWYIPDPHANTLVCLRVWSISTHGLYPPSRKTRWTTTVPLLWLRTNRVESWK